MFAIFSIMFRIYTMHIRGQFAGEKAAAWFSKYLNKPGHKLYKMCSASLITENKTWGDLGKPGEKVRDRFTHKLVTSSATGARGCRFSLKTIIFPYPLET